MTPAADISHNIHGTSCKVAAVHGLALYLWVTSFVSGGNGCATFGDTKIHFRISSARRVLSPDQDLRPCKFFSPRLLNLKCVAHSSFSFTSAIKGRNNLCRVFCPHKTGIDAPINVTVSSGKPGRRQRPGYGYGKNAARQRSCFTV